MIVKFFHRSKEEGSRPVNYFLGKDKDRKFARVLSGDPVVTEHLINATPYEHKYKSGVLSFTERANEISEGDKIKIMRDFETTLFPGLEPDQYDILWIEHADKDIDANDPVGRLELNFLIPCQELRSGKRLQPYYAAADKPRVNAWKNKINREVKTVNGQALSDPNAPNRKRKAHSYIGAVNRPSPYNIKSKRTKSKDDLNTKNRDTLRESINEHMLSLLDRHESKLKDRNAVLHELTTGLELTLERTSLASITVSHRALTDKNGKPQRVRLEGGIYNKNFDTKDFTSEAQSDYETNHVRRRLRDEHTLKTAMALKEQYHRELYADAVAPTPLDIPITPVIAAETPLKSTETLPVVNKAHQVRMSRPSGLR